jgi:hypothetical protein
MQDILKEVKILDDVDYFKEMIENESNSNNSTQQNDNEVSNETQGEEDESENLETYDTTRESY